MSDRLLLGMGRHMLPIPRLIWDQVFQSTARADLGFMTEQHHIVRNFVVLELLNRNQPISPQVIGEALGIPVHQVAPILDELERHMTFLFRNPQGEVVWAYPVTVDQTPHKVTLRTPEGSLLGQGNAA